MAAEEESISRGPKGGRKHQPGRGHDRKSSIARKKRFARKAAKERERQDDENRRQWDAYNSLPDEIKKLLGPKGQPKVPRPSDA